MIMAYLFSVMPFLGWTISWKSPPRSEAETS